MPFAFPAALLSARLCCVAPRKAERYAKSNTATKSKLEARREPARAWSVDPDESKEIRARARATAIKTRCASNTEVRFPRIVVIRIEREAREQIAAATEARFTNSRGRRSAEAEVVADRCANAEAEMTGGYAAGDEIGANRWNELDRELFFLRLRDRCRDQQRRGRDARGTECTEHTTHERHVLQMTRAGAGYLTRARQSARV